MRKKKRFVRNFSNLFQKLLYNSILKIVREQIDHPDKMAFLLPVLIAIIDNSTNEDYRNILQYDLKKVIASNRSVQVGNQSIKQYSPRNWRDLNWFRKLG